MPTADEIALSAKGFVQVAPGVWEKPKAGEQIVFDSPDEPVIRESKLHDDIIVFCESQWPRWKVVFARSDKKSTLPVGTHDLTIFASAGRTFCLELKVKGNKPDKEQQVWHKELEMIEHKVHVIYSFEEFLDIVK